MAAAASGRPAPRKGRIGVVLVITDTDSNPTLVTS
jgi:hypothetical protein